MKMKINSFASFGAVAQLGERFNGIEEVVGSIPISSTKFLNYAAELKLKFNKTANKESEFSHPLILYAIFLFF